jgi:integrase
LYLVLARCGLRMGEALGLDDTDPLVFDFDNRRLRVRRQLGRRGTIETPKSGHGRDVDLSQDVVTVLKTAIAEKKKAKLSGQFAELPRWTFTTSRGTPHSPRKRAARLVPPAGQGGPHRCGRTAQVRPEGSPSHLPFASLHIVNDPGCLAWLQEQLGHSDVRLTRTTYGRWFKRHDLAAAHQDARSWLVVTKPVTKADHVS